MEKIKLQQYHLIPPFICYIIGLVSSLNIGAIDQKLEDVYWLVYTLQFVAAVMFFFIGHWASGLDPTKIPLVNADFLFANSLQVVWQILTSILRVVLIGAFEAGTIALMLFRLPDMSNDQAGVVFLVLSILFIALHTVYSYFGNKKVYRRLRRR